MASVTVEGSLTPCTELARGERRTVALTPRVQRLIDRGYFKLIATHGDEQDEPVGAEENEQTPGVYIDEDGHTMRPYAEGQPRSEGATHYIDTETPLQQPSRGGSTAAWQEWFTANHLEYPADAGRDDLVAAWEQIEQQRAAGNG